METFISLRDVLLFAVLGLGYLVIYFAKKEQREMKLFGYIIGNVIIALSALSILSNLQLLVKFFSQAF